MPDYLIKQRQGWYAVLEIPKDVRAAIGKTRFKQTLKTDSRSKANFKVLAIVSDWKKQIALAREQPDPSANELTNDILKVRQFQQEHKSLDKREIYETRMALEDVAMDVAYVDGKYTSKGDSLFDAIKVAHGEKELLSENVESYLLSKDCTRKTIEMIRHDLLKFSTRFIFAEDATELEVRAWANQTLEEEEKLSVATRKRVLSSCRGYWRYLRAYKKLVLPAPFNDILPPKTTKKTKAQIEGMRKAFKLNEYHKLLAGCKDDDSLKDLIIIASHTGCRIAELCSLKLTEVSSDRFEIVDAKTEAGWRTIPIHSDIKQLVARLVNTATDGYLISGLTFNKYGDRSNAIGKRFGRMKTKLGFGPNYVFHSLRRTFSTQLENAEQSRNVVAQIMGHEKNDQTFGGYSDGLAFEKLREAIQHIDYSKPR